MVPRRVAASALAATRYDTVPSPWPLPPAVIEIQAESLDAVHEHSRDTLTDSVPAPPADAKLCAELVTDASQRAAVGPVTLVTAELPHARVMAAETSVANSRGRHVVFTAVLRIKSRSRHNGGWRVA